MNKRGQIFLIAALVIVLIITSFGIYNAVSTPKEDKKVYDLSQEIKYESSQIIDSGVYSASESETSSRIKEIIDYYARANPDSEIAVVYGDAQALKLGTSTNLFYTFVDSGRVGVGDSAGIDLKQRNVTEVNVTSTENNVEVKIADQSFNFKITEGQNFYLVIKADKVGGQFVATK